MVVRSTRAYPCLIDEHATTESNPLETEWTLPLKTEIHASDTSTIVALQDVRIWGKPQRIFLTRT